MHKNNVHCPTQHLSNTQTSIIAAHQQHINVANTRAHHIITPASQHAVIITTINKMHAQIKARQQAQRVQDALQDLHAWEQSIQAKDEALRQRTCVQDATTPAAAHPPATQAHPTPPNAASHTFDHYREKWDKFDIDAAMASSDDEQPSSNHHVTPPTPAPPIPTNENSNDNSAPLLRPIQSRALPKKQPSRPRTTVTPTTALEWKDRGNEAFRTCRYKAAVDSYTHSLQLQPTCIAYANRAMAYLKLEQYVHVVEDATMALQFDDFYVKAWQRRAAAYTALGDHLHAAVDLERAVLLEPDNRYDGRYVWGCVGCAFGVCFWGVLLGCAFWGVCWGCFWGGVHVLGIPETPNSSTNT